MLASSSSASYRLGIIVTLLLLSITKVTGVLQHYAMDIVLWSPSPDPDSTTTGSSLKSTKISTMLLSHAYFGGALPIKKSSHAEEDETPWALSYPPDDTNALLCLNSTGSTASSYSSTTINLPTPQKFVMLVPRGECTFATKARHAELLGASAVIIYGNLASRYTYNSTYNNNNNIINETTNANENNDNGFWNPHMIFPQSKYDYDCDYGRALIPISAANGLKLNPTYQPETNDPLLSSWDSDSRLADRSNLCRQYDTASTRSQSLKYHCASQQCLLTGNVVPNNNNNNDNSDLYLEACCAWDLPIWLYPDTTAASTTPHSSNNHTVTIPVAYMTAQQMFELKQYLLQTSVGWNPTTMDTTLSLGVILYQRWRPAINYSAVAIWLLGCTVATMAAYYSAHEYHRATQYYYAKRRQNRPQESSRTSSVTTTTTATTTTPPNAATPPNPSAPPEEVLELTAMHAVGFVVMASTSLLVLFYFKIYSIVKIMYAFGCSTAVSQVIFAPVYDSVVARTKYRDIIVIRTNTEDFGDITVKDIVTHLCGFSCGISWLVISFMFHKAEEITYFWVMQDVFGACMCITFLKVIRLNSIRVASILLIVAFFYDIFFVFITPHLFHGKSVMITVATSGGPPKADALWCEKYPSDKDCQGGNPLPMLLAIPKLFDYIGGSSLLGLGDIVLPGLLLSFAARYDAAKVLVGVLGGGRPSNQSYSCPEQQCCSNMLPSRCSTILCSGGYFGPLIVAYAIGLAMANTAVYVMHMGQPALLYLVPCCLGTMIYIGHRRNELLQLWDGPRVLQTADNILYNNSSSSESGGSSARSGQEPQVNSPSNNNINNLHAPIPMDEEGYGHDALAVAPPSAVDDDNDN